MNGQFDAGPPSGARALLRMGTAAVTGRMMMAMQSTGSGFTRSIWELDLCWGRVISVVILKQTDSPASVQDIGAKSGDGNG
jgi:hypothetical protein